MTSGTKTSEFLAALAVGVPSLWQIFGTESEVVKVAALAALTVVGSVYIWSRTKIKESIGE